jgi:hypothetical protein
LFFRIKIEWSEKLKKAEESATRKEPAEAFQQRKQSLERERNSVTETLKKLQEELK